MAILKTEINRPSAHEASKQESLKANYGRAMGTVVDLSTMPFIKPQRAVSKVFIHCSASSNTKVDAKEIDRWHKQNKWDGIGYHFFIKSDGTLQIGRNIERVPIAQAGYNVGSIAICLNGLLVSDFTQAQFDTLIKLCQDINKAYEKKLTFHGHCEVSKKTCPVFDYKTVLKLNKLSQLGV